MIEVIEVKLNNDPNVYLCSAGNYTVKKGVHILVETDRGLQYAIVTKPNFKKKPKEIVNVLFRISRIVNKKDFQKNKNNVSDSKKAFKKCQSLIKKYNLNMSLITATYSFDRKQLYFEFVSDTRVDFRSLAKDLANIYRTRIELHQVGVRDKAKKIGGCGMCGRELCCKGFLNDFESVSIANVKNQGLALNPTKINGVCGRLLCCLKYEDDCYTECRKKLPSIGKEVETDQGCGQVVSLDILNGKYNVDVPNKGIVECEINGSNK